jgi:hypothetical protein
MTQERICRFECMKCSHKFDQPLADRSRKIQTPEGPCFVTGNIINCPKCDHEWYRWLNYRD